MSVVAIASGFALVNILPGTGVVMTGILLAYSGFVLSVYAGVKGSSWWFIVPSTLLGLSLWAM